MSDQRRKRKGELARLCDQHEVDILYVFGSRAEQVREWFSGACDSLPAGPSDVDVGIKPFPGAQIPVSGKVRMAIELEDLLGVARVDLVCFDDADPFLAVQMVRGERLHARDSDRADEFELYVLRRAGDQAHLERERQALIWGESS